MKDDADLLRLMLEDQGSQAGVYHPGEYWQPYADRVSTAIKESGLARFRSNPRIGKGFSDAVTTDPLDMLRTGSVRAELLRRCLSTRVFKRRVVDRFKRLVENHYRRRLAYESAYFSAVFGAWYEEFRDRHDLPPTLHADPDHVIEIGGDRVGASYLYSFLWLERWSESLPLEDVTSGMEIGGGFGALTHTLLHMYRRIRKWIYVDIPPILYVGTQYLRHFFGDAVRDYRETREAPSLGFGPGKDLEILCLAPWQIEMLSGGIDLLVNTSSFQEMPRHVVANYARHVRRLGGSRLRACLYVYDGGSPAKTIGLDSLTAVLTEEGAFTLEELSPPFRLPDQSGHLLVGR